MESFSESSDSSDSDPTTAKGVVIGWGQNNSLGSGGAVRPPSGPGGGPAGEAPGSSAIFTNSA